MDIKQISWGESLNSGGRTEFLTVKQKGDKVQFLMGQEPGYSAKHFIATGAGWDISSCSRLMEGEECENCERYFEILSTIKQFKEKEGVDDDNQEVKAMKKDANAYSPSIEWYFPILNRLTGTFQVLKTTNGVRNKINKEQENGIDVMSKEWILSNTGSSVPSEIYEVSRVDSADVKKLTPEEEKELAKAQGFDISTVAKAPPSNE